MQIGVVITGTNIKIDSIVEDTSFNFVGPALYVSVHFLLCLCLLHTYSSKAAGFIKLPARSCRMHAFSNSTTSVTNLNLERHPAKIGGSDLVQPLTAVTLGEGRKFTLEK